MNVLINEKKTKYLHFVRTRDTKKITFEIDVLNLSGEYLGKIKWHTGWRKYVFEVYEEDIIFDETCMQDIASYLKELRLEREADYE